MAGTLIGCNTYGVFMRKIDLEITRAGPYYEKGGGGG